MDMAISVDTKLGITDGVMMCGHEGCVAIWVLSNDEPWSMSELIENFQAHVATRHND